MKYKVQLIINQQHLLSVHKAEKPQILINFSVITLHY